MKYLNNREGKSFCRVFIRWWWASLVFEQRQENGHAGLDSNQSNFHICPLVQPSSEVPPHSPVRPVHSPATAQILVTTIVTGWCPECASAKHHQHYYGCMDQQVEDALENMCINHSLKSLLYYRYNFRKEPSQWIITYHAGFLKMNYALIQHPFQP